MDKRVEPRVPHEVKFFVHIKECEQDAELIGLSVECVAVDLSTHGMQFKTDVELYSGSTLAITLGIGEPFAMYELFGTVRWVRPGDTEFSLGVLIEASGKSDFAKWEEDFTGLFGA